MKGFRSFTSFGIVGILMLLLGPLSLAQTERRCFPEAGPEITACIEGRLRDFWEKQGSLSVFGYPLNEATQTQGVTTQLFERARLEYHTANNPPYDLLLGRLGADLLSKKGKQPAKETTPQEGCLFFAETKQNLCPPFLPLWQSTGLELGEPGVSQAESLALFGLPLTPAQQEVLSDGQTYTVQWFERARFEDHGEKGILLGLLGKEMGSLNPGGFIKAEGSRLIYQGNSIQLKGVNYYPKGRPWMEMWSNWKGKLIEQELTLAKAQLGINSVRILLPYSIRGLADMGKVNKGLLKELREMLQIAGNLDLRLIITLFDFYEDFPEQGSKDEWQNLNYLNALIGPFVNDERILAWDIHNEPDHYDLWNEGKAARVQTWLGRMADRVHQLDPNHLVTVGMGKSPNLWQPGPDGRSALDYSDLISVHIYNAADAERQIYELRMKVNKPILIEEFGWPTGPRCAVKGYTEEAQEKAYQTLLPAVEGQVVGVFAWTLRDYEPGPTLRWDSHEEHYGLFRPDDTLKPAALVFQAFGSSPLTNGTKTNLPLTSDGAGPPRGWAAPKFIPESGYYVKGWFRRAWELFGGRNGFGLPLSEAFTRKEDGRVVQYFEAAVLEFHPEGAGGPTFQTLDPLQQTMRMISFQDIGSNFAANRGFTPGGHKLAAEFSPFYAGAYGPWRLGEPSSDLLTEEINGGAKSVQYFQRGRLELNPTSKAIQYGLLGTWAWQNQCQATDQPLGSP